MRLHLVNVNPTKLADELVASGVIPTLIENDRSENESHIAPNTWITFPDGTDMDLVQQIIDGHDPTPLPQPLTEIEQLRLEIAQANAELFEMMLTLIGVGIKGVGENDIYD